MPTLESSGTLTATIGTDHTVFSATTNKNFRGYISLKNMASGDVTEIRVKVKVEATGALELFQPPDVFTGAQSAPVWFIPPMPSDLEWAITLKQTAGTGRVYAFRIYSD